MIDQYHQPAPARFEPPDIDPVPRLALTIDEAAQSIGISQRSLNNLISAGAGFPVMRVGRRVLIPTDELRRWLAEESRAESA